MKSSCFTSCSRAQGFAITLVEGWAIEAAGHDSLEIEIAPQSPFPVDDAFEGKPPVIWLDEYIAGLQIPLDEAGLK